MGLQGGIKMLARPEDVNVKNTNAEIIQKDRKAVWHHLTQHKSFETRDPFIIAEGRGIVPVPEYFPIIMEFIISN